MTMLPPSRNPSQPCDPCSHGKYSHQACEVCDAPTKHTPGPWSGGGTIFGADGHAVATTLTPTKRNPERPELDVAIANARLIAAAPELLEALRVCVDRMQRALPHCSGPTGGPDDPVANLRFAEATAHAAIAKAEGK